jgi:predicted HTH domain antitoxin
MTLVISDEWLQTTHLTEGELLQEIVILLFQQERLTLGQASTWLGIDRLTFQQLLAERQIPVHYGIQEYEADLETIRQQEQP